jgi:primosomal protein N' (replication factor Y)
VTLTWHKGRGDLVCHYCGYAEPLPQKCVGCGGQKIERLGLALPEAP